MIACERANIEIVETLVNSEGMNFMLEDSRKKNVLYYCIDNKNKENQINIDEKKIERKKRRIKEFICKKPIYENYKMIAPDGEMLCFCDKKKMNWYLEKNAKLFNKSIENFDEL